MSKRDSAIHSLTGWVLESLNALVRRLLQPACGSVLLTSVTDLARSKADLIAENALLRHQMAILNRQSKRPRLTTADRLRLLVFARITKPWRQVLLIVQPATLLRLHRKGFQLFWKLKSKAGRGRQQITDDTIELIRQMVRENRLWGAERIRGELLKLGIHVAKRTIQHYMQEERPERPATQNWATFLKTHAKSVWACDFVPVIDLMFRQLYVLFMVELASRRVVHFGVTRHPDQFWVTQRLREATANGERPRFILRDNDSKYGSAFDAVAKTTGIKVLRTPYRSPLANAIVERFIGSVRRECLDHVLILGERQLRRVIAAYVEYLDESRPHQRRIRGSTSMCRMGHRLGPNRPRARSSLSQCWTGFTTNTGEQRDGQKRSANEFEYSHGYGQ